MVDEVSVWELRTAIETGAAHIIDVREPFEYRDGHVPGAQLITLGTLPVRLPDLPAEGELYIVCRSGNRSWHAAHFLAQRGIKAFNVRGGTDAWAAAGMTITKGVPA